MEIDPKNLSKLKNAGLHVSPPVAAYNGGIWIKKPIDIKGHHIPQYESSYVSFDESPDDQPESDAPMLMFYRDKSKWVVDGKRSSGKELGPGEFINEWATPEEAIEDILDFYFGDSSRMIELAFSHGKAVGLAISFKKANK